MQNVKRVKTIWQDLPLRSRTFSYISSSRFALWIAVCELFPLLLLYSDESLLSKFGVIRNSMHSYLSERSCIGTDQISVWHSMKNVVHKLLKVLMMYSFCNWMSRAVTRMLQLLSKSIIRIHQHCVSLMLESSSNYPPPHLMKTAQLDQNVIVRGSLSWLSCV